MSIVRSKSFSDWDQIRDLVRDQYPNLRFHKVRGSETPESYQVRIQGKGEDQVATIPINGKSALDNFVKATDMKVENNLRRDPKIGKTKVDSSWNQMKRSGINLRPAKVSNVTDAEESDYVREVSEALTKNPRTAVHLATTKAHNISQFTKLSIDQDTAEKCLDELIKSGVIEAGNGHNRYVDIAMALSRKLTEPGSGDKYYHYGIIPAYSSSISTEGLRKLCDSKYSDKSDLARNKNLPPECCTKLYKDGYWIVVGNPNCPKEVARDILDNRLKRVNQYTAEALCKRSDLSTEDLRKLLSTDAEYVESEVARSPSMNREIIDQWLGPWNKLQQWKREHPDADWDQISSASYELGASKGRLGVVASAESRVNKADYNYAIAAINANLDTAPDPKYGRPDRHAVERVNDPRFDADYQEFAGKLRDLYNDQGYRYRSILHELYPNFSDFLGAFEYGKKYEVDPTKIGKLCLRKCDDKDDGKSVDLKISPEDLK